MRVEPGHVSHIHSIAESAREADREELWASSFSTVDEVLHRGLAHSTHCWTVVDEEPVAMIGVVPVSLVGGKGVPWMVATHLAEEKPTAFARACLKVMEEITAEYPYLVNFVDDRNMLAIRFLEWLGFLMGEPEPHGVLNMPFRKFEIRHV